MIQTPTIFERREEKFLLEEAQYRQLLCRLKDHLQPDAYGPSSVCSLYYDTPSHLLIRRSLEKPVYKEKLRLRSYGVPGKADTVFVELKKKYKGIVYKRRVGMSLREARAYLHRTAPAPQPGQITREIDWFLDFYPQLAPAMLLSYDRTAYVGRDGSSLRITFDSHLLWREDALDLKQGVFGTPLLLPGQRLMEVKCPGAIPLWLCDTLDALCLYPQSFSKYGNAYLHSLEERVVSKGGMFCA